MHGLTRSLWPVRYKPYDDEVLSCWLVRLAHGHGLKVQTFCNLIFGNRRQIWNRDIDRLAPAWLIDELVARTGVDQATAYATSLRDYEGKLFRAFRASGTLQWIQGLKMYHRKREGHGQQFCADCLREGPEPYFRRSWRVAFNTTCVKHQVRLQDRCPSCGVAVAIHRLDITDFKVVRDAPLSSCCNCKFDLRFSPRIEISPYDLDAMHWLAKRCRSVAARDGRAIGLDLGEMNVMRHLVALLVTRSSTVSLREHLTDVLGGSDVPITPGRIAFEARPIVERHHLIQLAAWLMVDLGPRLRNAWHCKAIRYNQLLKGFDEPPSWYFSIVEEFSDWRRG